MTESFRSVSSAARHCTLAEEYSGGLQGIIFDCDGVLFDSKEANTAFYNHIRQAVGIPSMTKREADYAHMLATSEVLERMIPPQLLDAAREALAQTRYSVSFMPMMMPAPKMVDFLEHVHEKGVRLALCTNRSDSVHRVLEHFGLSRFFSPVMTVSHAAPKPAPDGLLKILETWGTPSCDVAYVGDSMVDEQAARRAGVPFWSFGNQELNARLHLSSFDELFPLLSPLLDRE